MGWENRDYHREDGGFGGGRSLRFLLPRTPLAIGLIIANVVIFIAQALTGPYAAGSPLVKWGALTFLDHLAFTQPWRWITYQYLHGSAGHVFFNVLGLYFFLPILEQRWGWKRAFAFYTAGGLAAGITYGVISIWYPSVLIGASGSLLAVLGAIAVIAPNMQVLAMMVIPITMRMMAILYAVFYALSVLGDRSGSDAAHLGGLAFGAAAMFLGRGAPMRYWEARGIRAKHRKKEKAVQAEREEFETIDKILAKVSASGMNSLTRSERNVLQQATERQRKAELARLQRAR